MSMRVSVLGAGGWGTALGLLLDENGHEVTFWEFREDAARVLREIRENKDFLPGIHIPDSIRITHDLELSLDGTHVVLITLPSHVVRSVMEQIPIDALQDKLIVSGTKGIENHTYKRISEIVRDTRPEVKSESITVLSGPSHAEEAAKKNPTVVVAASESSQNAKYIQSIFMSPHFRVYTSEDVAGVELGGSLKNVIAIAAGIIDGLELGDNLKAALINRGLVEMTRLGTAMGADPLTFAGLSGMGDLIVTCASRHSRNRFVGEQIGRGRKLTEVLAEMKMVAEGVRTTQSAYDLSLQYHIDMPITHQVYDVLFNDKDARQAVFDLMTRAAKDEDWG